MKSQLTNGRIPPNTECPYKAQCFIDRRKECNHYGAQHQTEYSCVLARSFDLTWRYENGYNGIEAERGNDNQGSNEQAGSHQDDQHIDAGDGISSDTP